MKAPGQYCSITGCSERLVEVVTKDGLSTTACLKCDAVLDWPNVKNGTARIVKWPK